MSSDDDDDHYDDDYGKDNDCQHSCYCDPHNDDMRIS